MKLDQAKLASINAGGKGFGTFELHTEARAQSPAGLIAVMTGSGTARLTDAEMSGPSPSTVADVVDAVLTGRIANDAHAIGDALVAAVGSSRMPLGNRDFAISVSDGALKLSNIDFQGADGQVEGTAAADLPTLGMSVVFQLTSVIRPPANHAPSTTKGSLPPAIVLYGGQLDHLAAVTVNADAGDLQRELTVRQMERNVEELEQARRADEERIRLEKEAARKRKAAERAAAQQKAQPAPLPPVIPEAAGTANSPPGTNGNSDYYFGTEPAPAPADAQSSNHSTIEPQPQNSTGPAYGAGNGEQNAAGQPIVIDPATGLQVAKPTPVVKPQVARSTSAAARPVKRRTSSDEVMKSLGGFQ